MPPYGVKRDLCYNTPLFTLFTDVTHFPSKARKVAGTNVPTTP